MKRLLAYFIIPLLALGFVSCGGDDDVDEPKKTPEYDYLVSIKKEKAVSKSEIVSQLVSAFPQFSSQATLISNMLCDIEIASITYNTENVDGNTVVASGLVVRPSGTVSYDHLLSVQHGTQDLEDAPSVTLFDVQMAPVFSGQIVVMADYLGYGASMNTDRQHPYLHVKYTGTACADMIEAAREYLEEENITETSDKVDLMGYSQGGQATVAALLEIERRGEKNRVGKVWAGGGPYDLEKIFSSYIESGTKEYSSSGYIPFLIRGMAYGEGLTLSDANIYAPEVISGGKTGIFTTKPLSKWSAALGSDVSKILNPDFFVSPGHNGNKDVLSVIDAVSKNSLVNRSVKPQSKICLYHSKTDETVPYYCAESAVKVWPTATLTDLAMSSHGMGAAEFYLRYMGLWDLLSKFLQNS